MRRLRGLRALVEDVVEHGSAAVEVVHEATAGRVFSVLESVPPIARQARAAHVVYDASVGGVYRAIRVVNRAVGRTLEVAIDLAEERRQAPPPDGR